MNLTKKLTNLILETMKFELWQYGNSNDSELNIFSKNNFSPYLSPEGFEDFLEQHMTGSFSVFQLNIATIKKIFEILDDFTYDLSTFKSTHKKGVTTKVGKYLSTFQTLLIPKLDLTYL